MVLQPTGRIIDSNPHLNYISNQILSFKQQKKDNMKLAKLTRLIAIRHCDNVSGDKLSDFGTKQAKRLGIIIKELLNGNNSIIILSSPTGRARETGAIIACEIEGGAKIEIKEVDELESDEYGDGVTQVNAIGGFINNFCNVIVITHHTSPSGIMNAFSQANFGISFPCMVSRKGTGFVFATETHKVSPIS